MGRRITRKQMKKDEFVSTVDRLIRRFGDHWKPATAGLVAVLLVILVWWGVGQWSGSRADEASAKLDKVVADYSKAVGAGGSGDVSASEKAFADISDSYGRTAQADVARLYEARIALGRGDTEQARTILVQLVNRHKGDALGRLAAFDLVQLRTASGQGAEVAQDLEKMVVGRDDQLPRDVALFELGKVFVAEQKPDQAKEYFQKLVDEFPESPYVQEARQKLNELG